MNPIQKRYDFMLFFDVQDGNPNGDPDAGNLPRVEPLTGKGLVTDVCLKRKVRNYVQIVKGDAPGFDIYIKEKAVLGRAHFEACKDLGINAGEASGREITDGDAVKALADLDEEGLPDGLSFEQEEDGTGRLIVAADAEKKDIDAWLKNNKDIVNNKTAKLIKEVLKEAKPRKLSAAETESARLRMCKKFYDIRTFGAVMSLASAPNCGQVRGPIQMTFARSLHPVAALEHSITRMAVATEAESAKQHGDNRTMGRKYTIPYGLYCSHGFVSAHLAAQTGFSQEDLEFFWEALRNMFEHDRSAARGLMNTRKLFIFEHDSPLGNTQAQSLFDLVKIVRIDGGDGPAARFEDYVFDVPRELLPKNVTLHP